jgi:hypothetical protein
MKKVALLGVLLLVGCANVTFDPNQYDSFITIKETADDAVVNCDKPKVIQQSLADIQTKLKHQLIYAKYRAYMTQMESSIASLLEIVDGAKKQYDSSEPSIAYCTAKMNNISAGATTIFATIGRM